MGGEAGLVRWGGLEKTRGRSSHGVVRIGRRCYMGNVVGFRVFWIGAGGEMDKWGSVQAGFEVSVRLTQCGRVGSAEVHACSGGLHSQR